MSPKIIDAAPCRAARPGAGGSEPFVPHWPLRGLVVSHGVRACMLLEDVREACRDCPSGDVELLADPRYCASLIPRGYRWLTQTT